MNPLGVGKIGFGVALTTAPASAQLHLAELCAALGTALGIEVTGHGLWHYHRIIEAMEAGDVDLAWMPPVTALEAIAERRVVPIAVPVRAGAASYATALFARTDSPLRGPADLAAVRAAWVDRHSAGGYLVIRAFLQAAGVDIARAFVAEQFLGRYDAVAQAVLEGRADVGVTFVHFDPEHLDDSGPRVLRAGWGDAKLRILATAGPIPADIVVAKMRTPMAIRRAVERLFVEGGNEAVTRAALALFSAERFVLPEPEHLKPLAELLARR